MKAFVPSTPPGPLDVIAEPAPMAVLPSADAPVTQRALLPMVQPPTAKDVPTELIAAKLGFGYVPASDPPAAPVGGAPLDDKTKLTSRIYRR